MMEINCIWCELPKECLKAKRFLPKVTEYKVKCPQMELSLCHDVIAWEGGWQCTSMELRCVGVCLLIVLLNCLLFRTDRTVWWWWWGNYSSFDYNEDNLHPVHYLQSNMQSRSSSGLININAQYRMQNATTHTSSDSQTSATLLNSS